MQRKIAVVATLAVSAFLLAGCSAGSSSGAGDNGGVMAPVAPDAADGGVATEEGLAADNKVITSGWISISVDDPIAISNEAVTIIEQGGGRVDNRSEQAPTDAQDASAQLTLRIPSDKVTETLDALKKLGTVQSVSLTSSDVTTQVNDLDARITALQGSVDRLVALMSSATTVDDLIELETALSSRQADLDSLISQRDYLDDQVSYSTIELQLFTPADVPVTAPNDFLGGLVLGWTALVTAAAGFVVALGVALPWLVLLAVIAAVIVLIVRVSTRKKTPAPH